MAASSKERTHLTPPVIAEAIGLNVVSVLKFIHTGQLKASNLGHAQRPRWHVSKEDLQDFLDRRSNQEPRPERKRSAPKPRKIHV